jgi:peptide/nickel transport system substrate-binding protein
MKKTLFVLCFLLLIPAFLLYAGSGEEKKEAPPEKEEEVTPEPAPPPEAKRELRITFAWPTYLDPAVGSDFSSSSSFVNLYDSLVYPTPSGDAKPNVATRWESSPDGLTWTFYLRKGVKFHNGKELTAEDVAFSMNRLITIGEGYGYLFAGKVQKSEAVDRYTVRFTLSEPYGPFLTAVVRVYILNNEEVMAHAKSDGPYGEFGDYGKEWLLTHDAGSGAYKVKEMRLEEYVLMERFDDYWGEFAPNAPDEVKFIGTTEPVTIRTMMSRQELEISDQWQTVEAIKALDNLPGVEITTMYLGTMFYYMMHTKKPPTDDVHFRKAMSWALDYDTVVEDLFPGSRHAQGPIAPGFPGHDPNFTIYERDLDNAKAELRRSKYYDKLKQYPVEVHWIAEVPDEEKAALLFMANMADIGIKVNIVKVPWLSVVEEMTNIDQSPNIVTVFVAPHYAEAGSLLASRYHSSSANTWEQNEWLQDPEIDRMIEDSIATIDIDERFAKYCEIQQKIDAICPSLYLFEQGQRHAYQASYIDWPAVKEENKIPVMGYDFNARLIQIYPERKK